MLDLSMCHLTVCYLRYDTTKEYGIIISADEFSTGGLVYKAGGDEKERGEGKERRGGVEELQSIYEIAFVIPLSLRTKGSLESSDAKDVLILGFCPIFLLDVGLRLILAVQEFWCTTLDDFPLPCCPVLHRCRALLSLPYLIIQWRGSRKD